MRYASPGGGRDIFGDFSGIGSYDDWWNSSENGTINA